MRAIDRRLENIRARNKAMRLIVRGKWTPASPRSWGVWAQTRYQIRAAGWHPFKRFRRFEEYKGPVL